MRSIDAQNRIWFSDTKGQTFPMSGQLPLLDHASVLRLDPGREWTLRRMTYDITGPNGVLLSQDGRTLYVAENNRTTDLRQLRAYPILPDGTVGPGIVLHTFGSDHRGPQRGIDGMCLDSEGNIVACAGAQGAGPGPMIYVFSPEGQVLETQRLPVDRPTNCTFGDPDLRTLYITTAEGHLFRVRNTGRQGWLIWPKPR
jgi:gluconolactonase